MYSNRGEAYFRLGKILFYILFCVCLFEALRSAMRNDPENEVALSYAKTLAQKPLRLHYESVEQFGVQLPLSIYLSVFLFIYIVFVIF